MTPGVASDRGLRIAVVGAGIAGLGCAWLLRKQGHRVSVFEAQPRAGGHTHTVDVTLDGVTHPVDTGFLVFNDRTYPRLCALFEELGVSSAATDMSFSVRDDASRLEWAGTSVAALFAQPSNALRPRFWSMLADIARFNRAATAGLAQGTLPDTSLGEFLASRRYGAALRDWYLLPMAAAIWSAPRREILQFPLRTFVRFCHNHGLLAIGGRPQWRTVLGGGRAYVERILAGLPDVRLGCPVSRVQRRPGGVIVETARRGSEHFDGIVLACHSDQSLALLRDASPDERRLLAAVRYQPNRVLLHTDAALLPRRRAAWSAWNHLSVTGDDGSRPVAVSYLINRLQPLPFARPVVVTLNPPFEPDPALVLREFTYEHPLLDGRAVAAQAHFATLQGTRRTWYAGAWLRHGFHEDGLASAHAVADDFAARMRSGRDAERIAA